MSGQRRALLPFAEVRAQLRPFSPRTGPTVVVLTALTLLGTLAETLALVLVARVAIAITSGEEALDVLGRRLDGTSALGVALAALGAKLALTTASSWLAARMSAQTVRTGRLALLDAYFRSDWLTQSKERTGELQDYLTSTVGRLNGVNQSFVSGLGALVSFLVVTVSAVTINPLAAVGCAAAALILLVLLRPLSRRTKRYSWAMQDATRALAGDVTEAVRTSQEVRVFGVRSEVLRRLDAAEERASRPLRSGNFTNALAPTIYQTLTLVFLVLAVGAVGLAGGDEVTSLGAAVLLLLRGLAYGQELQRTLTSLNNSLPFLAALHERKALYDRHRERAGSSRPAGQGLVVFEDIGFRYADGAPEVLHDLTVVLHPKESIGIVGPSGSGKSTLLQLLLRLRSPTSGRVAVDGTDLWELSAEDWSRRVAFVPQEARLLDGTVADNIRFYRELDDDAVERAARLAHIHDDVMSWADGYSTRVGDGGGRLSGGQRQRLSIARALAASPDLLVLDEPTSALDLLSEARLQETLEGLRGRVGLVIVAHRLTTIAHCDRVLVLQDGRCQSFDTHERLLETSAFYRDAVQLSMIGPAGSAR